jgi:hypothetical protein
MCSTSIRPQADDSRSLGFDVIVFWPLALSTSAKSPSIHSSQFGLETRFGLFTLIEISRQQH